MDNQQEIQCAYLAGILDGEGWVGFNIRRRHHTERGRVKPHVLPWVSVANTSHDLIERCAQILTLIGVGCNVSQPRKTKGGKLAWTIHVAGMKRVNALLGQVHHRLTAKHKNAVLIMDFIKSRMSKSMSETYTPHEWSLVNRTRSSSSETTRDTPFQEG